MSLTLSNNNDRSGTYYYGDVITMINSIPFTTIYLCIDETYQTIIADYPDAFVDYMVGLNSVEAYGHKNSSFSCMINNIKSTNNYYA